MNYTPAPIPEPAAAPAGVASVLTRRRRFIILGIILLAAFGYFGFTAMQSATSFYLPVDELVEQGPGAASVQVKGSLVEGSFVRESTENTIATFTLQENGAQVAATYDGVLPDLFFNPHSEIVLGGTYHADEVFVADRIYVKCPSKYQSLETENPYDTASA